MARGVVSGLFVGSVVSVLGLGAASVLTGPLLGPVPGPLAEAETPSTESAVPAMVAPEDVASDSPAATDADPASAPETAVPADTPNSPVGSVEVAVPDAPDLPADVALAPTEEPAPEEASPLAEAAPEGTVPRADTDPLDEPSVVAIEGTLTAPDAPDLAGISTDPLDPVLPSPQSQAPSAPQTEADLTVSTVPADPATEDTAEVAIVIDDTAPEEAATEPDAPDTPDATDTAAASDSGDTEGDFFVVDLGADAAPEDDAALADAEAEEQPTGPRIQLQGGENTLLADRDTGVVIRRPGAETPATAVEPQVEAATPSNALVDFAADPGELDGRPLMSIILVDDGSMSAASAALAGLPFPVTIALDPSGSDAAEMMASYREDGFEVAALAMLPEGALPSDAEITLESVFRTLPESIAVLDMGEGGFQADADVTEQAMSILAEQGRGFITASQGLNMAGRAAEQAEVPAAVIYRDLDPDDQDARVVRRFVDQAAFRARQESGVVLVGRVRPDTISALILWGTANSEEQVQIVPVSALLTAE